MKHLVAVTILISLYAFSTSPVKVGLELGEGFYYLGNRARGVIYFRPTHKDSAWSAADRYGRIVWPAIRNVVSFGFNTNCILVIKKEKLAVTYWVIDKTKNPNEVGAREDKDRISLANVTMITSTLFNTLQKRQQLKMKPIAYYDKEVNEK